MMIDLHGNFYVADESSPEEVRGSVVLDFTGSTFVVVNESSLTEAERETFKRLLLQLQRDAAAKP